MEQGVTAMKYCLYFWGTEIRPMVPNMVEESLPGNGNKNSDDEAAR